MRFTAQWRSIGELAELVEVEYLSLHDSTNARVPGRDLVCPDAPLFSLGIPDTVPSSICFLVPTSVVTSVPEACIPTLRSQVCAELLSPQTRSCACLICNTRLDPAETRPLSGSCLPSQAHFLPVVAMT